MIDTAIKDAINKTGKELGKVLPNFYGKITFNYFDGHYVSSNVEQSIKNDNLVKGAKK